MAEKLQCVACKCAQMKIVTGPPGLAGHAGRKRLVALSCLTPAPTPSCIRTSKAVNNRSKPHLALPATCRTTKTHRLSLQRHYNAHALHTYTAVLPTALTGMTSGTHSLMPSAAHSLLPSVVCRMTSGTHSLMSSAAHSVLPSAFCWGTGGTHICVPSAGTRSACCDNACCRLR